MDIWQVLSLCAVLLSAIYGFAQLALNTARWLLRPSKPTVTLMVSLEDHGDVEQQLRFVRWLSKEWDLPICVQGLSEGDESARIADILLDEFSVAEVLHIP